MPGRKDRPSASSKSRHSGDAVARRRYPTASAYFKKCQDRLNACAEVFGVKGQEIYVDAFAAKRPVLRVFESYYADLTNDHHPESIESVIAIARVREHAAAEALEGDDADALALRMAMFASIVGFLSALERKKKEHDSHDRVRNASKDRIKDKLKVKFQALVRQRNLRVATIPQLLSLLSESDLPGLGEIDQATLRKWYDEVFPGELQRGRPRKKIFTG